MRRQRCRGSALRRRGCRRGSPAPTARQSQNVGARPGSGPGGEGEHGSLGMEAHMMGMDGDAMMLAGETPYTAYDRDICTRAQVWLR